MTNVKKNKYPFLEKLDAVSLKSWLREGVFHWFSEGNYSGFGGDVDVYFISYKSIHENIVEIYRGLSEPCRGRLRRGLVDLIAELESADENVPVFNELLTLAVALPARDVLGVLPAKVGGGAWGRLEAHKDEIFSLVVEVAVALTSQTDQSYKCLRALPGFPNFRPAYAGLVLVGLCRAKPERFVENMALMREPLARMFSEYRCTPADKRIFAKKIINAVGLEQISQDLNKLKTCADNIDATDNWFLAAGDDYFYIDNGYISTKEGERSPYEIIGWEDRPTVSSTPTLNINMDLTENQNNMDMVVNMERQFNIIFTNNFKYGIDQERRASNG